MSSDAFRRSRPLKCAVILALLSSAVTVNAGSWNGIEPLKSRRDDVVRVFGKPLREGDAGTLHFNVAGGVVLVSFVDEKFVNSKKLRPELVGTVLEIVLQHEASSNTPESMKLTRNKAFTRDESGIATIFRNLKEGVAYTFLNGKLRTTRYMFSDAQFSRARR